MVMKRVIPVILALMCSVVSAEEASEIKRKVGELNLQSMKLLGVSINAVRYLVDASPSDYLLLSSLETSGEINYVRELEAMGYVKTQVIEAKMSEREGRQRYLRILPLESGEDIQRCMLALEHNNLLTMDASR